jgi:predicted nucleic acid-binding protein
MSAGCAMSGRSELVSEKPSSVESLVLAHRRVGVDSNVLIYLLEQAGPRAEIAAQLVDAIGREEVEGILASVGLAEALTPWALADDGPGFEMAAAAIRQLGFRIVALDADVAEDAAWVRGRTGAAMPDAIHVACALAGGATAFVTNDRRIRPIPRLEIIYLDDLVA